MKKVLLSVVAAMSLATTTMAQTVPNYVPTNGLVGWWPFNGNANDESGNGNNGTPNNVSYTLDRFGNSNSAVNFPNGNTNSEIVVGTQVNPSIFTVSVWIRPTGQRSGGFHTVLSRINQYDQPLLAPNNFEIQQTNPDLSYRVTAVYGGNNLFQPNNQSFSFGNNSASLNTWNHLVLTFDGSVSKTYLNGAQVSLLSVVNYFNPTSILAFGNRHNAPNYEFNWWGSLDDIGIWNRALSQQEITNLYNANICYDHVTVTDTLIINTNMIGFSPVTYQNTIKVWPNPAHDHITIDNGNIANLNGYQIKISNVLGQQVFQSAINQQQFYINLSTWTGNGTYYINLINPQGVTVETRVIVVQ